MSQGFDTKSHLLIYASPWLRLYEDEIIRGGQAGRYAVVERADSVVVIPLTPDNATVLLSHYRYPAGAELWEFPMGYLAEGEAPEQAAIRELCEETGITASSPLIELGSYFTAPGLTPQRVTIFIAQVTDSVLQTLAPPPEDEEIHGMRITPVAALWSEVRRGLVLDSFTLVALLHLRLYLEAPSG